MTPAETAEGGNKPEADRKSLTEPQSAQLAAEWDTALKRGDCPIPCCGGTLRTHCGIKKPKWICDREVCGTLLRIDTTGEYGKDLFITGKVKRKFPQKLPGGHRDRSRTSLNGASSHRSALGATKAVTAQEIKDSNAEGSKPK